MQTLKEKIQAMEKTIARLGSEHSTSRFLSRVVQAIKTEIARNQKLK